MSQESICTVYLNEKYRGRKFFLIKKSHSGKGVFFLERQSKLPFHLKGKPRRFPFEADSSLDSPTEIYISWKHLDSPPFKRKATEERIDARKCKRNQEGLRCPFQVDSSLDCHSRKNVLPLWLFFLRKKLPSPILFFKVDCADAFMRHLLVGLSKTLNVMFKSLTFSSMTKKVYTEQWQCVT